MALASGSRGGGSDFSAVVLGTDFAVDARAALLSPADREEWHDCLPDLDELQVVACREPTGPAGASSASSASSSLKIKYVSRLEYLRGDIKKGEVEIPDFVIDHDKVLEHRPLTDYGIEPDPLHLADVPAVGYSLGRYEDKCSPEDRWYSGNYM